MDTIDKINQLLAKKGVSAAQMSRELGFSNSVFTHWKQRKSQPSTEKLKKMAEYFEVPVSTLMSEQEAFLNGTDVALRWQELFADQAGRFEHIRETLASSWFELFTIGMMQKLSKMDEGRRNQLIQMIEGLCAFAEHTSLDDLDVLEVANSRLMSFNSEGRVEGCKRLVEMGEIEKYWRK